MCLRNIRPHRCRHCPAVWTHTEGLELCPEGDKLVLLHGYCAPIAKLLDDASHHVSHQQLGQYLEDMCDECKDKLLRDWEAEVRTRDQPPI